MSEQQERRSPIRRFLSGELPRPIRTRSWLARLFLGQTTVGARLARVLLPVTLVLLLLLTAIIYQRTRGILEGQISSQLERASTAQSSALNDWRLNHTVPMLQLASDQEFRQNVIALTGDPIPAEANILRRNIQREFVQFNNSSSPTLFNDLLLIEAETGQILASTREIWLNQVIDPAYIQSLNLWQTLVESFPLDTATPIGMVTLGLVAEQVGQPDAYVLGLTSMDRMAGLLEATDALRIRPAETYLAVPPGRIMDIYPMSNTAIWVQDPNHPLFSQINSAGATLL
ncbi:MAG: hypothetical protein PVG63_06050, partial [Anaerolineales bacterium]